jgi:hypothetical protein
MMEIRDVIDEDEAGLGGRGGEVGLPPELWQCVFDWVDTWKGLGSVSRVCRAFHDLALLQIKRRRLAFETRRTYSLVASPPPPNLHLNLGI